MSDGVPVTGPSVLRRSGCAWRPAASEPECFGDLHLDQVVAAITAGRDEYDLTPFFHAPLADPDDVAYRHEVFTDLADDARRELVASFARDMRLVREQRTRAAALLDDRQRWRVALDAARVYGAALVRLTTDLAASRPTSRALRALLAYLEDTIADTPFTTLSAEAERLAEALDAIRYHLTVHADSVVVRRAADATDDGAAMAHLFARFGTGSGRQRLVGARDDPAMNQVESAVLERVARLYPDEFGALQAFVERFDAYLDPVVTAFDREVQFYLAVLAYVERFERAGLPFCFPTVSAPATTVHAARTFDVALAQGLIDNGAAVVCNDVELRPGERILVVSGANQGGKTTFARAFGQLHYLAALGCPVPGRDVRLALFDELLTHFEQEEDLETLRGKFQDELVRMHAVLERATPRSIVILNEALTATTSHDALLVGSRVLRTLLERRVRGVWVTFIDELASFDPAVVSLVCGVDPDDPARRTFEVGRRPADGRAHAVAIARSHRLTYHELRRRMGA